MPDEANPFLQEGVLFGSSTLPDPNKMGKLPEAQSGFERATEEQDTLFGKPQWSDQSKPVQDRVGDFILSHAKIAANNPNFTEDDWHPISKRAAATFPGIDTDKMKRPFLDTRQQLYNAGKIAAAKEHFKDVSEPWDEFVGRRAVPFFSAGMTFDEARRYQNAKERLARGEYQGGDYARIAHYEALQEHEAKKDTLESIGSGVAHVPAIIGEAAVGGGLLKALGAAPTLAVGTGAAESGTTAVGRAIGKTWMTRTMAQTALMPSMYLPASAQAAIQKGGDWNDIKNLGPAYAMGTMQVGVLGAIQQAAGSVGGTSPTAVLSRVLKGTGTGLAGQEGIDTFNGLVTEQLPLWGHKGYGTLGDILDSKVSTSDTLKHALVKVAVFATFSAMHAGTDPNAEAAKAVTSASRSYLEAAKMRGLSESAAAAEMNKVHQNIMDAIRTGDMGEAHKGLSKIGQQYADALGISMNARQLAAEQAKAPQAAPPKPSLPPAVPGEPVPEAPVANGSQAPQSQTAPAATQPPASQAAPIPDVAVDPVGHFAQRIANGEGKAWAQIPAGLGEAVKARVAEIAAQKAPTPPEPPPTAKPTESPAQEAKAPQTQPGEPQPATQADVFARNRENARIMLEYGTEAEQAKAQTDLEQMALRDPEGHLKWKAEQKAVEARRTRRYANDAEALSRDLMEKWNDAREAEQSLARNPTEATEAKKEEAAKNTRRAETTYKSHLKHLDKLRGEAAAAEAAAKPAPNEKAQEPVSEAPKPTAAKAFTDVYPDAKPVVLSDGTVIEGRLKAKVGNTTVLLSHDAANNLVTIDFSGEGVERGKAKDLAPVVRSLRTLLKSMKQTGVEIQYGATDASRTGLRTDRATIYAQELRKAGYELVEGPKPDSANPTYRWRYAGKEGEFQKEARQQQPMARPPVSADPFASDSLQSLLRQPATETKAPVPETKGPEPTPEVKAPEPTVAEPPAPVKSPELTPEQFAAKNPELVSIDEANANVKKARQAVREAAKGSDMEEIAKLQQQLVDALATKAAVNSRLRQKVGGDQALPPEMEESISSAKLSDKEKAAVLARVTDSDGLRPLADKMGLSHEWVRQLALRGLAKLKTSDPDLWEDVNERLEDMKTQALRQRAERQAGDPEVTPDEADPVVHEHLEFDQPRLSKLSPEETAAELAETQRYLDDLTKSPNHPSAEPPPVRQQDGGDLRGQAPNPGPQTAAPAVGGSQAPATPERGAETSSPGSLNQPGPEAPASGSGEAASRQLTQQQRIAARRAAVQAARKAAFEHLEEEHDAVKEGTQAGLNSPAIVRSGEEAGRAESNAQRSRAAAASTPGAPQPAETTPTAAASEPGAAESPAEPTAPRGDTGGRPVRDVGEARPEPTDPVMEAATEFAKQEGGHVVPEAILSRAYDLAAWLQATVRFVRNNWNEFAGNQFPRTARLAESTAQKMIEWVHAKTAAIYGTPKYIDQILGPKATQESRRMAGAIETQWRLDYMHEAYLKRSADLIAQAQKTPAGPEYGRLVALAAEARQNAADVGTIIGAKNSPLTSDAQYQAELNKPEHQEIQKRWEQHMVPEMEGNFKKAMGMDPADAIDSFTQRPGHPINLKNIPEGEALTSSAVQSIPRGPGRGNLGNVRQTRLGFAKQAKGTGTYDIDLGAIIANSLGKGLAAAGRTEALKSMIESEVAYPGEAFKTKEGYTEFKNTFPPKGNALAEEGQTSLYVKNEAAGEYRQALQVDEAPKYPLIHGFNSVLTRAALASSVEFVYHGKNLMTFLFKPGVRLPDLLQNAYDVVRNTPDAQARLFELAKMGRMKDPGMESGLLAPERFKQYDPTYHASRVLDGVQKIMRLTAEDAFDRMSGQKPDFLAEQVKKITGNYPFENTELNKTNFINQLGQYNKRSQNSFIVLLRDLGISPFATAGTNYYVQSIRGLTGDPGAKTTGWGGEVAARAETFAKMGAVLGTVAAINQLFWHRPDGDDKTPLGSIKVGAKDGKTQYFDLTSLTGLTRGARQTGVLALAEGERKGSKTTAEEDKGYNDIVTSLIHPFAGPGPAALHTAVTGKNMLGMDVRQPKVGDQSDMHRDLTAAAWQANPAAETFRPELQKMVGLKPSAKDREANKPVSERLQKLFGPFGLKTKK